MLKPYPAYKNSGVPWLGRVPEHWEVRRLKHTFRRVAGGSTPSSAEPNYWDGDVVWVTPSDISRAERLKSSLRRITQEGLKSCSSELVPPGSIIVTSRAPVGNVALADVELCTNQGCKALVTTDQVMNPMFGFSVLRMLKGELQSLATGTTFAEISTSKLGIVPLPLPPLPEQSAIVRFLDYVDRRIRRYIRAKQKLIKLLEEQKQAITHHAVTRGLDPNVRLKPSGVEWLGDVPEHWEVVRVKQCARTISKGTTPSTEGLEILESGSVRFLKAENITGGRIVDKPLYFIDEKTDTALRRSQLKEGDVLFVIAGATLGKTAVVEQAVLPANTNQAVAFVRPNRRVFSAYLALWLQSPRIKEQVWLNAVQSAQPNLSMADLGDFLFPLPPTIEQKRALLWLESETISTKMAIEHALREIFLLREYRIRLIADVVAGKLDVREAAARLPDEAEEPGRLEDTEPVIESEEDGEGADLDTAPEEAES